MLQRAALLLSVLLSHAVAADAAALPVAVAPGDARLHWAGRWDTRDAGGPRCEWPAGSVRFTVAGGAVNAVLGGSAGHAFQVAVDGEPTSIITLADGQSIYPVVGDLPPGPHVVELCKRTECWGGPVQVRGLQIAAGATLTAAPARTRRVEFLGDSITCGYGNEAKSQDEHFSFATENAWLTWGAIAARALDADYSCAAMSGIWLQREGDNHPLPERWDRAMPLTDPSPWDFARAPVDVVVVNLGTNDGGKPIEREHWFRDYRAFIAAIRAAYPKAHVFLCIGPMGQSPDGIIAKLNEELAAALRTEGETRAHAVALPDQKMEDGIGADWHPSLATHRVMAARIAAAIRTECGW